MYFNTTSSVNGRTSYTQDFVCPLSPSFKSLYDILFLMGKSDLVNICTLMVCTANLVLLSFQFLQFLAKQKHHKYHAAIISSKVLWLLISFSNDPKLIVVKNDRRQWLDIFHENKWTINSSTTKQTDRKTDRPKERKQIYNQRDLQIQV